MSNESLHPSLDLTSLKSKIKQAQVLTTQHPSLKELGRILEDLERILSRIGNDHPMLKVEFKLEVYLKEVLTWALRLVGLDFS